MSSSRSRSRIFDQIRGQNLRTFSEKRGHVMASVRNALSGLRDALGASVAKAIEQGLETKCFMLGGVDRQFDRLPNRTADYMRQQLGELVGLFEAAIKPEPPPQGAPELRSDGHQLRCTGGGRQIPGTLAGAAWPRKLRRLQQGALVACEGPEPGGIAGELSYEYDGLKPVADLVTQLRESVSRFLNTPIQWTPEPAGRTGGAGHHCPYPAHGGCQTPRLGGKAAGPGAHVALARGVQFVFRPRFNATEGGRHTWHL